MEAVRTSETSVYFSETACLSIPEMCNHGRHRENMKSPGEEMYCLKPVGSASGKFYQTSAHSHQSSAAMERVVIGVLCVRFEAMGSPTVWFDGLYFRPFVRRIISTFNFSANFVFHFIFLSDTDILRCHRYICLVFILQLCPVMEISSV
jgi:hypothetical protein